MWIEQKKISSIGLNISNGVSMHGISINISNTLSIFSNMEVCGYSGLTLTSLKEQHIEIALRDAFVQISEIILEMLYKRESNT